VSENNKVEEEIEDKMKQYECYFSENNITTVIDNAAYYIAQQTLKKKRKKLNVMRQRRGSLKELPIWKIQSAVSNFKKDS